MRYLLPLLLTACATSPQKPAVVTKPDWITKSDELATAYTLAAAELVPEMGSSFGFRQFDSRSIALENDMESKQRALSEEWKARVDARLKTETDADLLVDLKVLKKHIEQNLEGQRLNEKYGSIPFMAGTQYVFGNLRSLINEQSDAERKAAAVSRFQSYVRGHSIYKPFLIALRNRLLFAEAKPPKRKLYPLKEELEKYLKESPQYVAGIKQLLEKSGRADWKDDYKTFEAQAKEFDAFVAKALVPKARTDYRLPPEVYVFTLKALGNDDAPKNLIRVAKEDYALVRQDYVALAKKLAAKHGLAADRPADVLAFLKTKKITEPKAVEKLYYDSARRLEQIIKENNLVTLPQTPLKIRLAGEAESKAHPVPHLSIPPLVNNKGERPEFVVPTAADGKLPFDDFSYEAAAIGLTAHEGRPGHDLQFSSMLDNGISIIRARYAFNSVNAEGWGLYAEDLVFPYLDDEAKFASLQMRLWRIARMFLDPQLQLGEIKPADVIAVYTNEVLISKRLAELEVERSTFDMPGQAPSYYYGLKKLLRAKNSLRERLAGKMTDRCFHDAVLAQGLLPLDLIVERLAGSLDCPDSDLSKEKAGRQNNVMGREVKDDAI